MRYETLLPCAICVQRFGDNRFCNSHHNIALRCVLQRNRKPSHPSRHVVGAVIKVHAFLYKSAPSSGKMVYCFLYCEKPPLSKEESPRFLFFRLSSENDPAAGSPTATLLRLLLPLLMKCRISSHRPKGFRSNLLHCTIIGNNDGRCVQMAGT